MINKIKNIFSDKDLEEILTKGFYFLLFRIGGLFAGYLFMYLIAKNYGASVNGLVALSFTFLLCISILGRLGIDINIVRYYTLKKTSFDKSLFYKLLLLSFSLSTFLALCLYLFRDLFIYRIFNKPQLEPYLFWVVISIPFWSIILICGGLFRGQKKNIWYAFLENPGRFILSLLVFSILIIFLEDKTTPIISHFIGVFTLAIIAVVKVKKSLNTHKSTYGGKVLDFIKESYPMMISGTILVFLGWADTFILGIYESDKEIGVYTIALKIAALTSFSLHALNSILAPKIAKSYQKGDVNGYQKMIQFSTKLNFFITLIIIIVIVYFRKFILGVFGNEFLSGDTVLLVLCIGQFINSLSGSVGIILQMTGRQKVYQNIVLIALMLNIVLNFILTPRYGTMGAALATVFSISFWNITGAIYLKRKLKIISYFKIIK
ncbi:flippase [uncultured Winogradskyella sp.]|uniref:flippase n=1 Tax=uncultured Winogradskyella sp. TaxID=395353 RepID=UPI002637AE55|nr:flippase [uncultured Winogradskyella sp.]